MAGASGRRDAARPPALRQARRPTSPSDAERLVRDWQRAVLDLVRQEAEGKLKLAKASAYAVNATGLLVMVSVFAATAFIPTGLEVAVAAGTTVAAQKVLEAIFGDQAVRSLAEQARDDLLARVRTMLDAEAERFDAAAGHDGRRSADGPAPARRRERRWRPRGRPWTCRPARCRSRG